MNYGSFMDIILLCAILIVAFQVWNFSRNAADIGKKLDEIIKKLK